MRPRWALALAAAGASASPVARADVARADAVEACIRGSTTGQEQRRAGRLSDAAQQFASCSRPSCPAVVRRDCARWTEEVDLMMPTVVFAATDSQGGDRSDVRVFVDGSKVLDRLDGRPMPLDPGAHTVRYEGAGGIVSTREFDARVGEKNRIVAMRLEPPPPRRELGAPASAPSRPVPPLAWALGGVAVVGLGVAGYFDASAIGDVNTLRSTCGPRCSSSDVDAIDRKYAIAGVALGTSVIAAGIAIYLYLTRAEHPPAAAATLGVDGRAVPPAD
jgi:hypothetical protein